MLSRAIATLVTGAIVALASQISATTFAPGVPCDEYGECDYSDVITSEKPGFHGEVGDDYGLASDSDSKAEPDFCEYRILDPKPNDADSIWGGRDPKTGNLFMIYCADALKISNRQELINFVGYLYVPTGSAPAQLPASPEVLAHRALAKLQLPTPKVGIGPNVDRVVVKSWTWLWVDEADPIEVIETSGPVTVTLRAELTSVKWDMGEPVNIKFPWGEKGSVTCDGPGIPPGEDYVMNDEPEYPACAYKYIYRSDEERTNGVGRWPVTATTTWRVTWTSNTGASGGFQDADMQGAGSALVGEIRTILVAGEGTGGG